MSLVVYVGKIVGLSWLVMNKTASTAHCKLQLHVSYRMQLQDQSFNFCHYFSLCRWTKKLGLQNVYNAHPTVVAILKFHTWVHKTLTWVTTLICSDLLTKHGYICYHSGLLVTTEWNTVKVFKPKIVSYMW